MTFESLWPPRPLLTRPKRPPYTTDVLSRLSGFRINNTARTTDRRGRLRPPAVRDDQQQLYLAVCGQPLFLAILAVLLRVYGLCGFVRTLRDARGPVGIVRDGWRARGSVEGPWECERSWGCAWLRGASDGNKPRKRVDRVCVRARCTVFALALSVRRCSCARAACCRNQK